VATFFLEKTMSTILPTDDNNNPIPALRLRDGGAQKIAVTSVSARNATAFDAGTSVISLYSTIGVYVRFGASTVAATPSDHFFPPNIYYDIAIGGEGVNHANYVAVLRADNSDGILYISEKV
jgi:hypothetical protein